jgi:hypothetical protein
VVFGLGGKKIIIDVLDYKIPDRRVGVLLDVLDERFNRVIS